VRGGRDPWQEFQFIFATNIESAYHMCQLMHPLLKAAGSSSIVFNSSVAGVVAIRSGTLYSATKGACASVYRCVYRRPPRKGWDRFRASVETTGDVDSHHL